MGLGQDGIHSMIPGWDPQALLQLHEAIGRCSNKIGILMGSMIDMLLADVGPRGLSYGCGANCKDLRKYLIPSTGCCCPQKKLKRKKILFFGVMPYAKMGSAKKRAKINHFFPYPPFCKNARIAGWMLCLPHCLLPPPPFRVSCPILHLALLSENDESGTTYLGIQDCHNIGYFNPDADVPQSR